MFAQFHVQVTSDVSTLEQLSQWFDLADFEAAFRTFRTFRDEREYLCFLSLEVYLSDESYQRGDLPLFFAVIDRKDS